MMMSMAGKKGSMQLNRRRDMAGDPASAAGIVNCALRSAFADCNRRCGVLSGRAIRKIAFSASAD
jgi:hypothetical protein